MKFATEGGAIAAKTDIAKYLILDALVGNTDRHHENWGLVLWTRDDQWYGKVAPSFDHATSLGREWHGAGQVRAQRILDQHQIGRYSERARGAVYWSSSDDHAPGPLELVRRATRLYPEIFGEPLSYVARIDPVILQSCVEKVPNDWMSPLSKCFAIDLMAYNLSELRKLAP